MPQPRRGQAAPAPPSVSQTAAGQDVAPGTGGAGALVIPPAAGAAGGAVGAGVAGATVAGAVVAGLAGEAAIAYGTKQIIDGLLRLFRRKIPLDVLYVITALERQYPGLPADDIERIRQAELQREAAFQAKTVARWQTMLPKLLAIPNPQERAEAVRKFRERERQIMEARQHAMLERGQAAVERTYLRVLSPQGAYWALSPHVKAHTLDCLVMGGRFHPWAVLDEIHPPLHHGCPCVLFGLNEALQRGLMTVADIPKDDDLALRRARADIARARKLMESVSWEQYGLWAASRDGENLPRPDAAVDLVLTALVEETTLPIDREVLEATYTDHLHPRDRVGRWVRALGFPSYKVGGTVRDSLMGRHPKDDDFVVMAHPDQIRAVAEKAGARVDDLKVRDRVVGVRVFPPKGEEDHPLPREGVEIAPPRIEVSTGEGRHDFTIVPHPAVTPGPKPMTHWHGTTGKELGRIRRGFFTTSSKQEAEDYAGVDDYFDPEDQGTLVPVTVDLKNPKVYEGSWPGANSPEVAALAEQGYDGVVIRFPADESDPSDPKPAREWAYVFDPAVVKVGHEPAQPPSDPIRDDAVRRDFTVNALYQDVASGEVVDPTGTGREDLEAGLLRTTSPESFREDPLRMLRATRFMSTHGFTLHPLTREQMVANAPQLDVMTSGGVSGTAVTELNKTLMGAHVGDALRAMRDTGTLQSFLPELSPAVGFDQESRYHDLPLDEHIFSVVENLAAADAPLEVRLAALFHDAGKPEAAFRGEDDRLHYYGDPETGKPEHAEAGAAIARTALERLNYPAETVDRVERLVQHHMVNTEMKRPARVRGWRADVGADLVDDLLAHRRADITAKGEADPAQVEALDRFAGLARAASEAPSVRGDLAITGRDLIAAGVPPGPQMGLILDDLLNQVIADPSLNRKDWLLAQAARRYPPDVPQTDDIMQEADYHEALHPRNRLGRFIDKLGDRLEYREHHPVEASNRGSKIIVGPKFFDLPERTQDFVIAHELGHDLDDALLLDPKTQWVWDAENWRDAEGTELGGPTAKPGERIADAYAVAYTGGVVDAQRWPAIVRIAKEAKERGLPIHPDIERMIEPEAGHAGSRLAVGYAEAAQMVADGYAAKAQSHMEEGLAKLPDWLASAKEGDQLDMGTVNAYVSTWDDNRLRVTVSSSFLPHPESIGKGAYLDDPDAAEVIERSARELTDKFKATTLATQRKQLRGGIAADKGEDGKRAYKAVREAMATNDGLPRYAALRDRFPDVHDNVLMVSENGYGRLGLISDVFVTASRKLDMDLTSVNAVAMSVHQRLSEEMSDFLTGPHGPHSVKPGGSHVITRDPAGVLRHEWAHGLWDDLTDEQRGEFIALLPDWDGIAAGLSQYAAGDPESRERYDKHVNPDKGGYYTETFAEAVALTTGPYFTPADWPEWVRNAAGWIDGLGPQ